MPHWTNVAHDTFVNNVQGVYVVERMTNVVGVDFVHDSVQPSKMWATMWAGPIISGMSIDMWAKDIKFLGR